MESNFLKSIEGHTKGPFGVLEFEDVNKEIDIMDFDGMVVAVALMVGENSEAQRDANAKLISKSYLLPDIYKLLDVVAVTLDKYGDPYCEKLSQHAKQLLDKLNS